MRTLDVAIGLAAQGFPVFPCSREKTPAISKGDGGHGFHDATTDPEQITKLFAARGAVLVGCPTGEVSGFDALDLDYKHRAQEWEAANAYRLPETRVHQTQSGGRHYLFRHVHGVRNSAGRIAAGVDVRGSGGYVVLPPSDGYEIINDADIADWPDWLLQPGLVFPKEAPQRVNGDSGREPASSARMDALLQVSLRAVSGAGDGQKHFTLRNHARRLGGLLHYGGFTRAQALDALMKALPATVKDWKGARKTAEWGLDGGAEYPITLTDSPTWIARQKTNGHDEAPPEFPDDPGYLLSAALDQSGEPTPPPEPQPIGKLPRVFDPWNTLRPVAFPMEALPDLLAEFVENRSRIIGADPSAIAWSCISACSAAIDGRIRLRMKRHDNWVVPPAIWVALVGLPSTKKSPIIDTAWSPLERAQGLDMRAYQTRLAAWRALPKKQRVDEPEPEMPRRLITHDATMEALQDILAKQDRGIGVLRDELAGWIGSLEKYAPGKGGAADRAFALQAYNGGSQVVDRVMRGMLSISNVLTTVCGGIQPDRLRQFRDLTDDGLMQRFISIIVAPGSMGEDVEDERANGYAGIIDRLLRISPTVRLTLCDAGHEIREAVQRRIFSLEQTEVLGPRFVGFCGKMPGLWGRLALVLHLITTQESLLVSAPTAMAAQVLLFKSVLPNAARIYAAMGGAGAEVEATQSIAGYILTKKLVRIVMSDLTSNVRVCRHRTAPEVRKLLSPLEAGGWLVPEKEFDPTAWVVTPLVHVQFAVQAEKEAVRRAAVRALITGEEEDNVG